LPIDTQSRQWGNGKGFGSRLFDVAFASLMLVLLGLSLLLVALAVKATSRGPALFRQTRVGRGGRPFAIYKFRTMTNVQNGGNLGMSFGESGRVTSLGRVLRTSKIDELPQLINVLRGDMSLVGPRPELPEFVGKYAAEDRAFVLSVAPGLTDFASIRFRHEGELLAAESDPQRTYEEVIMPAKLRYCRFYVRNANLRLDLYIIMQTISVLIEDLISRSTSKLGIMHTRASMQPDGAYSLHR
jgi:lipopolysaccharide/colanic/teichoic acid biosynthesis glycosyltransferase